MFLNEQFMQFSLFPPAIVQFHHHHPHYYSLSLFSLNLDPVSFVTLFFSFKCRPTCLTVIFMHYFKLKSKAFPVVFVNSAFFFWVLNLSLLLSYDRWKGSAIVTCIYSFYYLQFALSLPQGKNCNVHNLIMIGLDIWD